MTTKYYEVTSDGFVPDLSWLYTKIDRNDILRIAITIGNNAKAIEGIVSDDGSITVPVPIRVFGGTEGFLNSDGSRTVVHRHRILPA